MLFGPEAHERIVDDAWDAAVVESAIREIAGDAEASFDDG